MNVVLNDIASEGRRTCDTESDTKSERTTNDTTSDTANS